MKRGSGEDGKVDIFLLRKQVYIIMDIHDIMMYYNDTRGIIVTYMGWRGVA